MNPHEDNIDGLDTGLHHPFLYDSQPDCEQAISDKIIEQIDAQELFTASIEYQEASSVGNTSSLTTEGEIQEKSLRSNSERSRTNEAEIQETSEGEIQEIKNADKPVYLEDLLNNGIQNLEEQLFLRYTAVGVDEEPLNAEEVEMARLNTDFVRSCVEKYLFPIIINMTKNSDQLRKQAEILRTTKIEIPQDANLPIMVEKKRTSWGIYLSDIAKTLPGWKEAKAKLTFASVEYKKLSLEEKAQIVTNYYLNHGIPIPTAANTNQRQKRICGLDAFRKHWYDERKKIDPTAKGLDSRCTQDWSTLSRDEKAQWTEVRRQQLNAQ